MAPQTPAVQQLVADRQASSSVETHPLQLHQAVTSRAAGPFIGGDQVAALTSMVQQLLPGASTFAGPSPFLQHLS